MATIRNYINPEVLDVSDADGKIIVRFRSINPQYNLWTNDSPEFIYSKTELSDLEEQMLFIEDVLNKVNTKSNDTAEFRMFHENISTILEQAYDTIEANDEYEMNTYEAKPIKNQIAQLMNTTYINSKKFKTHQDIEQLLDRFENDLANELDRPEDLARFLCTNLKYNPN